MTDFNHGEIAKRKRIMYVIFVASKFITVPAHHSLSFR